MAENIEQLLKAFQSYDNQYNIILSNRGNNITKTKFSKLIKTSINAFNTYQKIQLLLGDYTSLQLDDPQLIDLFNKVRNGKKFHSISGYHLIYQELITDTDDSTNFSGDITDLIETMPENLDEKFHEIYSTWQYSLERIAIGPILVNDKIPNWIVKYFNEIREAFAFQLYRSCLALCRSLLEVLLFESIKDTKYYNQLKSEKRSQGRHLCLVDYTIIAYNNNLIDKETVQDIDQIREWAKTVLHKGSQKYKLNRDEVYKYIKNTVNVVEQLSLVE